MVQSYLGASANCTGYIWYWLAWGNGTFTGGLGQTIGQNVRIAFTDTLNYYPIRSMGISSLSPSYWIIPRCYYTDGESNVDPLTAT